MGKINMLLLVSASVLVLGACSISENTTSTSNFTNASSKIKEASSRQRTTETKKETSTPMSASSSTSETKELEVDTTSAATKAFDALAPELKLVLMADTVDDRVQRYPGLDGLTLNYTTDNETVYLQLTSGAGSGHPIYRLKMSEQGITPEQGVCYMGIDGYMLVDVNEETIPKEALLNHYNANTQMYDDSTKNVVLSNTLKNTFDEQLARASDN